MLDFGQKWFRMGTNATSPKFVPFRTNLTHLGSKFNITALYPVSVACSYYFLNKLFLFYSRLQEDHPIMTFVLDDKKNYALVNVASQVTVLVN